MLSSKTQQDVAATCTVHHDQVVRFKRGSSAPDPRERQRQVGMFAQASGFRSACVYGGQPKREQLQQIQNGAPIIVSILIQIDSLYLARLGFSCRDPGQCDRTAIELI